MLNVKGLRFHFTTEQLRSHMMNRAIYHTTRANEKERALPELRTSLEKIKMHAPASDVTGMTKINNYSNYHIGTLDVDLEVDILDHKNKALVFEN